MSAHDDSRKGICILSFDSGGAGTYSQLLILKEYMHRIAVDSGVSIDDLYPADYFDLMGGVGFGGLLALMLGRLRMTVSQAMEELEIVASTVFPEDSQDTIDREGRSKRLEEVLEDMLQAREIPLDVKMNDLSRSAVKCKVVLYAAASSNITHPHAFRTYSSRGANLNSTIVEAVCATMAAPSHLLPVTIGSRLRKRDFVGGPLGANNPTRELLKEAGATFGNDKRVVQIISLGCGAPTALSLEALTNEAGAVGLLKTAADCQVVARELSTRLFNVDAYLRLNMEMGIEMTSLGDWSMLGDIDTHTGIYAESIAVTEALDASWMRVRQNIGNVTLGQLNQSSGIKVIAKTAPAVSRHFVMRKKELELMVRHLITLPSSGQRIFPITGMGGCGKTQMVSYFLQEHPSLYTRSAYVNASSSDSIKSDLQTWARALGDGHERDEWEDGFRILANTPPDEQLVVTLDNADDPTLDLVPFIPKNTSLTIIITSRNRDVGNLSTTYHLEMGEMVADEALSTLLQAARRELPLPKEEMESIHLLMKELGCLAVALVQAGTYCHQLSDNARDGFLPYTFTQYLSLFYLHRAELMKLAEPSPLDSYQRGVYTTLDLSYKALPQTAREFLHFISFFHHTDIPLRALEIAAEKGFEDGHDYRPRPETHQAVVSDLQKLLCSDGRWNELQVQLTIRTLRSASLVSATSINDSIFLQIHPLIQSWSRDSVISTTEHYRAMTNHVLTVCGAIDDAGLHRYLLPHILDMLEQREGCILHVNDMMSAGRLLTGQGHHQKASALFETALGSMKNSVDQSEEKDTTAIILWLASAYKADGRWFEAEKLQVKVLEQRTRILGVEHPRTITAAANLAATYADQGRLEEAEELEVEVLDQRTRSLGVEHPATIKAAANLAATYRDQGRLGDAEKLAVEVLEMQTKSLGEEHPDAITAAANLAGTYALQGRLEEAEKLQVGVLEQRTRILGAEHPDTIVATANLAATSRDQGRLGEAEKLEVEVLEQQTRIMGTEHPDAIIAAANLAATYARQGRWEEAEKLEVKVLELQTRILGVEHPNTILAASNLAVTYAHQGRLEEAEKLQVEVLERRTRILGAEHPQTIGATGNLACTYREQGRWTEAETLRTEVLEQQTRTLGADHPDAIVTAANLAATYRDQGRLEEAEKLEVEILEQRTRLLGAEHPHTRLAASNLAVTYADQGQLKEAEKLQVKVLEQVTRILGAEHPYTIGATANLACTYRGQGRWKEAEKLQVDVLEQRMRILGADHPHTILAAANLASTYRDQKRLEEAEKLEVEVLEQRTRILGAEHPHTILVASNLAVTYAHQGRLEEAEKLQMEVLERRTRVLGAEHPHTIGAIANLAGTYNYQRRWEEAASLLAPMVQLSLRVIGREHPHTQDHVKRLAVLYEELGQEKDAQEMKELLLSWP